MKASPSYSSINDLPLYNFIKLLTTGDLTWLGNTSEVWQEIFMDYCDKLPTKNTRYVTQITGEIKHLESKIYIIQTIIDRLTISYFPELIPELNSFGFYYEFTTETMLEDLKNVKAEMSQFVVQKGVLQGQYDNFLANQPKEATKEEDFDTILTELSKFQGYHLKSKDLTVSEYIAIFNRYNKQNE